MFTEQGVSVFRPILVLFIVVLVNVQCVKCAPEEECFGSGSIVGAVIGTLIVTLALLCAAYFIWKHYWKSRKGKHLVLETDPEGVGDQYAFDNPCFKDAGLTPSSKSTLQVRDNNASANKPMHDMTKTKWTHWSPIAALASHKYRKTLDDSCSDTRQIHTISLRSHDFTGLGFNISGNMRDGIFVKDVLHRGPASESGKIAPGDRILSLKISFNHMVYEDALTILSYASPYEVELEVESGPHSAMTHKNILPSSSGASVAHPVYRSGSSGDLTKIGKAVRQRLFTPQKNEDGSNYSTLKSVVATLERKRSKSPVAVSTLTKPERSKKPVAPPPQHQPTKVAQYSPSELKLQLEQNLLQNENKLAKSQMQNEDENVVLKIENETQKSEAKNKFQKFGVRVLPMPQNTNESVSPKHSEKSQNDNNINLERSTVQDEIDRPVIRDNKNETVDNQMKNRLIDAEKVGERVENIKKETDEFVRQNSVTNSGIRRDKNGIPQEIPDHMMNAAVAARKNRKSSEIVEQNLIENSIDAIAQQKSAKKPKGKAPAPPAEKTKDTVDFGDISTETIDTSLEVSTLEDERKKMNFSDEFVPDVKKSRFSDNFVPIELPQSATKTTEPNERPISEICQNGVGTVEVNEKVVTPENKTVFRNNDNVDYSSDSDADTDQNSVINNTIELNASDITIHHSSTNSECESNDANNDSRKAASLGDLSKFEKGRKSNTGTLERAQSLDITDTGIPTLSKKRKATNRIEDEIDGIENYNSDELLYSNSLLKNKEPRLTITLNGLNTFQRNRLKKSSEWGNLEDAIMNSREGEEKMETDSKEVSGTDDPQLSIQIKNDGNRTNDSNEVSNITINSEPLKNMNGHREVLFEKENTTKPVLKFSLSNAADEDIIWTDDDSAKKDLVSTDTSAGSDAKKTDNFVGSFDIGSGKIPITDYDFKYDSPRDSRDGPFSLTINSFDAKEKLELCLKNTSESLIENEKYIAESPLSLNFTNKLYDTNISDDIKVSRHSLGSLERPKSDVLKNVNKFKELQSMIQSDQGGVSSVTITGGGNDKTPSTPPSKSILNIRNDPDLTLVNKNDTSPYISNVQFEHIDSSFKNISTLEVNPPSLDETEPPDFYTTAIDTSLPDETLIENSQKDDVKILEAQRKIKIGNDNESETGYVSQTQLNSSSEHIPELPKTQIPDRIITEIDGNITSMPISSNAVTFVTEIQVVTPSKGKNVSEIEIKTNGSDSLTINNDTEALPNLEMHRTFNNSSEKGHSLDYEDGRELNFELQKTPDMRFSPLNYETDKNNDIEQSPKKLSEMRFSTSSYSSSKSPEKRLSHIDLIRSNFEKNTNFKLPVSPTKSKIPVAKFETKSPSPEKTSPNKSDGDISDEPTEKMFKNAVISTPTANFKYQSPVTKTVNNQNITVTSIRTGSRIPSGQYGAGNLPSRPPIPPRRSENTQITSQHTDFPNSQLASESTFQQWVFNPADNPKGTANVFDKK